MTRAAILLAFAAAWACAQESPEAKQTYTLKPHYSLGGELEGEAELTLDLTVRMQVPSKNMDHRVLQAQKIVRHFRDTVAKVEGGKIAEVTRTYFDAYEMQKLPGAQKFKRIESPLHTRRLTIGLDAAGKRVVTADGEPALPPKSTEHEVHTERYEAALPDEPVSVGSKWEFDGARLRRAVGNGFGEKPEGKLVGRFVEVKELVLDPELTPDAKPLAYAIVRVEVETEGRMGPKESDPNMKCHLSGTLWFDLAERKLAKVELEGQAHIKSVEREGGVEMTITANGPLKLVKRFWFPRKPEQPGGDVDVPRDPKSGLPTPPDRK